MTIGELLAAATATLTNAGIQTARLDVLILLSDVLQQDKATLLAHTDQELTSEQSAKLDSLIKKRVTHLPLAYIRGHVLFYGRDFIVSEHVLTPRPETEDMITFLKNTPLPDAPCIADIGTGSGCIGITAALEIPHANVDLYDIDAAALDVAQKNATALGATVAIHQSDLLKNMQKSYDAIITNLPYVPDAYMINEAAKFEPALALFSGPDGLDHYRSFWKQIDDLESKPSIIITESLPSQHHTLAVLARISGYTLEQHTDFIQLFSRAI